MSSSRRRTLQIDILMDSSGVQRGVPPVQRATASLSENVSRVGAMTRAAIGVVATGAVMRFGQEMAQQGARIEGIGKRVDTVFGADAAAVRSWAESNRAAFGMSTSGVLDLAGSFGDLLVPMGFAREDAAALTMKLLSGANALSEWTGGKVDAATAGDKMIKAMLGEREGLKELGIALDQATVDALLAERGQSDLTGAAKEQAEAVATVDLIWQKSADALRAYEEGGNEALRSQRALTSQTQQLRDELALELAPVFTDITDRALSAAEGVQVIVEWFQNLPAPAKTAALAIGGIGIALWALYSNPVIAGLALVAGAVAAIGGRARDTEQAAADAKAAVDALAAAMTGQTSKDWLTEQLKPHPEFTRWLKDYGIEMSNLDAILQSGDWGVWYRENEAGIPLIERFNVPPGFPAFLQDLYEYYELAGDQNREDAEGQRMTVLKDMALGRLQIAYGRTSDEQERAKRTAGEWKDTLDQARQSVINLTNAQLDAASPVLQVIRARQAHADAEARLIELRATGTASAEEINAAELDIIETEGRLQGAQGLVATTLGVSTAAYRQLAIDAGFYGDELERIVRLLWDYDAAPKPEPDPYDGTDDEGDYVPR